MAVYHDEQYLKLMQYVLANGVRKEDRTGTGTISIFDATMRFDVSDGSIPLLTTKKIHWPSVIYELLWYISGNTNTNYLIENGVRIWNEWANDQGDLGPVYGAQLRNWNGVIDQLSDTINILKTTPDSRRMIVSYWNPAVLPDPNIPPKNNPSQGKQALPPCHMLWQLYTRPVGNTRQLSMKLVQRSADVFLGVPFNIAQYSILLHMLCHITGYIPGEFIWSGGDVHIYSNHLDQCDTQLSRAPYSSPTLTIARAIDDINDFEFSDFVLNEYQSHPPIKATVAV